jgi:Family of unknown function (DUF5636)
MAFFDEVFQRIPALRNEPQKMLDTVQAVSDFLETDNKRFEALISLNEYMEGEIESRGFKRSILKKSKMKNPNLLKAFEIYEQGHLSDEEWAEIKKLKLLTTHVLSNVLSRNEYNRGFQLFSGTGYPYGKAVRLQGVLDADMFLNGLLAKKRMWKDPGAGFAHGEFTHRIQWFMIMERVKEPDMGWSNFYAWIGKHQPPPAPPNTLYQDFGLWAALVDRPNLAGPPFQAVSSVDFRCPEHLTTYLIDDNNKSNIEFLHAFCKGRYNKRKKEDESRSDNWNNYTRWGQIWSKRIYKTRLENLSKTDAIKLAVIVHGIRKQRPYILKPQAPIGALRGAKYTAGHHFFMEKIDTLEKLDPTL